MQVSKTGNRGGFLFNNGERGNYDSDFLARVLLFTMDLHAQGVDETNNNVSICAKTMLLRAVRLMPPSVRELCERLYADATLPSKSTVSRANLFLDVTFMHIMAEKHHSMIIHGAVLFGLTDASPQRGIEYQIMEYYSIHGKMLIEVGHAAIQLKLFPTREGDIVDLPQQLAVMERLMALIRTAKGQHVFPPQCMAQRQTSLPHKGHCAVRMCRLENLSWVDVGKFMLLFFSFTNDRGTEKSFKQIYYPDLHAFPEWRPSAIVPENDEMMDDVVEPVLSFRHTLDISGMFLHQSIHIIS